MTDLLPSHRARSRDPPRGPAAVRPMDPMVAARYVLDGILRNDLFIVAEPEYRAGVEAQEVAHRKTTQSRDIKGT
jgi:hypothetical protein